MHQNICSKCGKPFDTKNPKRIVCPDCLYLDRAAAPSVPPQQPQQPQFEGQPGGYPPRPPQQGGYGGPPRQGGYPPRPPQQGGYGGPPRQGGYGGPPRQGGFGGPPRQGGFGGPRPGGPRPGGFGGPRPGGPPRRPGPGGPKRLLIPPEIMAEIEKRYKLLLPLPNPDAHVVIGEELNMEAHKVFFAINVIRQKMRLPKVEFPKRPLAVTEDQLVAVKSLYEPFLPVPPIGIHKIIAKQLKMDEWRVHVAIGLVRKQQGMDRWNEDRPDLSDDMKAKIAEMQKEIAKQKAEKEAEQAKAQKERAEKAKADKAAEDKPKKAKPADTPTE